MEIEKFEVLTKVHQDRLETKTKKIAQLEVKRFGKKSTKGIDLLGQTIKTFKAITDTMKATITIMPTKEVISCSMDVTAEIYRFLEAFADGMIKVMEYDEKEKGGKK